MVLWKEKIQRTLSSLRISSEASAVTTDPESARVLSLIKPGFNLS